MHHTDPFILVNLLPGYCNEHFDVIEFTEGKENKSTIKKAKLRNTCKILQKRGRGKTLSIKSGKKIDKQNIVQRQCNKRLN